MFDPDEIDLKYGEDPKLDKIRDSLRVTDKLFTISDWGSVASGDPRYIKETLYATNYPDVYCVVTPPTQHTGLYSHGYIEQFTSKERLLKAYTHHNQGLADKLQRALVHRAEGGRSDRAPSVTKLRPLGRKQGGRGR